MITTQLLSALILFALGFAFGLAFDLYRVLRVLGRPGRVVTAICDLLFWLAYTVWVFATLVRFNSGEVRFYVFLSLGLGGAVYFHWFSRSMLRGWYTILRAVVDAVTWLAETINRLLDVLITIVVWPYRVLNTYLLSPCLRLIIFLLSPVIALLRFLDSMVKRLLSFLARPLRALGRRVRSYLKSLLETPPEPPVAE